jgi:hypothetical protein
VYQADTLDKGLKALERLQRRIKTPYMLPPHLSAIDFVFYQRAIAELTEHPARLNVAEYQAEVAVDLADAMERNEPMEYDRAGFTVEISDLFRGNSWELWSVEVNSIDYAHKDLSADSCVTCCCTLVWLFVSIFQLTRTLQAVMQDGASLPDLCRTQPSCLRSPY